MIEALVYLLTLALFSFVAVGSALIRGDMLIVACIPAVFMAAITGFVMGVYAADQFGIVPVIGALIAGGSPAWWCRRRLTDRDLLIAIYLMWVVALVLAMVAFGFPDRV
jgi:hypothetical protein